MSSLSSVRERAVLAPLTPIEGDTGCVATCREGSLPPACRGDMEEGPEELGEMLCPICFSEFDDDESAPCPCQLCGNAVCRYCVVQIQEIRGDKACPFCRRQTIEATPPGTEVVAATGPTNSLEKLERMERLMTDHLERLERLAYQQVDKSSQQLGLAMAHGRRLARDMRDKRTAALERAKRRASFFS
eukprot:gnl/TRDRNA2_/TRDRNA2_34571_c0_seq1.p1 gnl/TRDRNA2_/TRDRNA2_34571_c0~~gnl/TRDRNA2_/TRDRNA2_34571_c0_seq1.p1  ORF type:complete len:188 (-),score=26.51 gnl/TRDRNA2_/TRDRNA2_34571_c0_seq1:143-706(-)